MYKLYSILEGEKPIEYYVWINIYRFIKIVFKSEYW